MAPNCPSEHQEQVYFIREFERLYPDHRIFAIPNGGSRHRLEAANLKREGVTSGIPDLFCPSLGLWVEMKRERESRISPEQKDWLAYLESIGYKAIIGRGAADALEQVKQYFESGEVSLWLKLLKVLRELRVKWPKVAG